MARRRMFSLDVVDTDRFLDLPLSAQALYFHLGMRADDDGFVSNPKRTVKMCDSSIEDLDTLISQGYLIHFPSGILVLVDWHQCNCVQKDRYTPTVYQEECSQLSIGSDKRYYLTTTCIHAVSKMDTQDSTVEDRVAESSEGEGKGDKERKRKGASFLEGGMGETSLIYDDFNNSEFIPLSEIEESVRRQQIIDVLNRERARVSDADVKF